MTSWRRKVCSNDRWIVLEEYCASSSIHGVSYIGGKERTRCERFWWLTVFLLSMTGCGVLIFKTYRKWEQTPVIVTFSEKSTPVSEIPFPSVTLCPETKALTKHINFTAELTDILEQIHANSNLNVSQGPDVLTKVKTVAHLCNDIFHSMNFFLPLLNESEEETIVETLKNISFKKNDLMAYCEFSSDQNCLELLQSCVTEEGICYTFNALPQEKIFRQGNLHTAYRYLETVDDMYNHTLESFANYGATPPFRARSSGLSAGLQFYFFQKKEDVEYVCKGFTQGYRVILHEAYEYPYISKRSVGVPLGQQVTIAVKPQMIETSETLKDYSWQKRQCFFNHERYLRFFRHYSQDNCELECLTNFTLQHCGCVRFSMPHSTGTQVCSLIKWQCMETARKMVIEGMAATDGRATNCNCLPSCSSIQYETETSQVTVEWEKFTKANKFLEVIEDNVILSGLIVYFKDSQFITSKRSELYGVVDFLANCGGLLGLFMGVSILSLVEIFYFLTVRPLSLLRKRNQVKRVELTAKQHDLLDVVAK